MKINIILVMILFIFSCNKNYNFVDDVNLLEHVEYYVKVTELDSSLVLFIELYNNADKDMYVPITNWFYDGKKDTNLKSISQPTNPGLLNTIHYYPIGTSVSGAILDIGWKAEVGYYPSFLKIEDSKKRTITLEIPKYKYGNDKNLHSLFKKNIQYTFLIKLSIISKENISKLIDNNLESITLNDTSLYIRIPVLDFNKPNYNLYETKLALNRKKSKILNKLSTNKLEIKFNYFIK